MFTFPAHSIMHRLSSYYALRRFRIVSLLILLMFLTLPVVVAFLCYGVFSKDVELMRIAAMILGFGFILKVITYIMAGRLRCPLCLGVPFRKLGCTKHKSAETLLGSYQAEVAASVLFKDKFRCPYCGERTAMEVRERRRQGE